MSTEMLSKKKLQRMSAIELALHMKEIKPCLKQSEIEFNTTQSHADYLQYKKLSNYFSDVKMIYKLKSIYH